MSGFNLSTACPGRRPPMARSPPGWWSSFNSDYCATAHAWRAPWMASGARDAV